MPQLNNLSDYFFQKTDKFVTFKGDAQLDFQSDLKKENTVKVELKNLSISAFFQS